MIREGRARSIKGPIIVVEAANPVSCKTGTCESASCCSGKPMIFRAYNPNNWAIEHGDHIELDPPHGNPWVEFFLYFVLPGILATVGYLVLPVVVPVVTPMIRALCTAGVYFVSLIALALLGGDRTSRLPQVRGVVRHLDTHCFSKSSTIMGHL